MADIRLLALLADSRLFALLAEDSIYTYYLMLDF